MVKDMIIDEKKILENNILENYSKSLEALIGYISQSENNPNEKKWNKFARVNNYLSAESMGYISENGFNKLCKEIRKVLKQYRG